MKTETKGRKTDMEMQFKEYTERYVVCNKRVSRKETRDRKMRKRREVQKCIIKAAEKKAQK